MCVPSGARSGIVEGIATGTGHDGECAPVKADAAHFLPQPPTQKIVSPVM